MNVQNIYEYLSSGNTLRVEDRVKFQIDSVEELINLICQRHRLLFHATRDKIPYMTLLRLTPLGENHLLVKEGIEPPGRPTAFAANYATVLLIKALFSNHRGLDYSYGAINRLGLNSINDGVVNTSGFIYLLKDTSSFKNAKYSSWEKYTTETGAKFGGAISVTLDDLPPDLQIIKQRQLSLEELRMAAVPNR